MPDGAQVNFPDDMPREQIKGLIASKYPEVSKTAAPNAPTAPLPEPSSPVNDMMAGIIKSLAGRTGRIATGIAASPLDLPVIVGQSAYDATRGVQQALGSSVAPEYKIPLPSEGAKQLYDIATGNVGNIGGEAGQIDRAAEAIVPLVGAATKIVPELAKQFVPRAKGAVKQLAQRAQELSIPLRVDQIAPSRVTNTLQKISQEIPFSGVDASEAVQVTAWNKALAKTLGQDADNLSPEVIQQFKKDASVKFKNVLKDTPINIVSTDVAKIKNIKQGASQKLGADSLSIVDSNIKQALKDIKEGDISGEKLANVRSYFLENASTAEGNAKKFIGKIVDTIDDIAARNIPKEKVQELQTARKEWRNYRTIEPLLEKSTDGNINPTELLNRVKASKYIKASQAKLGQDELVDLARIGKQFLVKKGGSDTFQKYLGAGGIGALGTGLVTNPALALQGAALAGGGMAANRGLQSLNRGLVNTALTERAFDPRMSKLLTAIAASSLNKIGE